MHFVCYRCALGVATLSIQEVKSGALITHMEPVFEVQGFVRIYSQLSNNNPDPQPWMTLIDKLLNMSKEAVPDKARTTDGPMRDQNLRPLEERRLKGLKSKIDFHHSRPKRGLFDFVGSIASDLFGIPSADDIKLLQEANTRLATAVDGLVHTQQAVVGRVNILGRNQARIMTRVNNLIEQQEDQARTMMQFVGDTQKHLRLMTLTDIVSDALDQLAASNQQVLLARSACEGRKANEILVPVDMVRNILSSGENHQPVSVMDYYGYMEIEKITLINNENYCVVLVPLFASDKSDRIVIHTFPICHNETGCFTLYQPPPFIFNTRTEEIYFPETCFGPIPKACRPSVKYDSDALPCVHGLYTSDPEKLRQCPATWTKQRPPPGPILTATINRFVVQTESPNLYHYRCNGARPRWAN